MQARLTATSKTGSPSHDRGFSVPDSLTGTRRLHTLSPLGFEAGDANLFRYVGNNPTNLTDPSGLEEKPKTQAWLVGHWTLFALDVLTWLGPTPPKPTMPFREVPEWGRDQVGWGTGPEDAEKRIRDITPEEARKLDPDKVRRVRDWYQDVYRNNPNNASARQRVRLMQRILDLQKRRIPVFIS